LVKRARAHGKKYREKLDPTPTPPYVELVGVETIVLIEIRDDVIWAKHLKGDPTLYKQIVELKDDEIIKLKVDGVVGAWAKMKTGSDGRPTLGIKPVGAMASVWARLQKRRGDKVRIEWPEDDDPFLRLADTTFEEWYSAEDEEAFGELQPL